MAGKGTVTIKYLGDVKDLQRSMGKAKQATGGFTSSLKKAAVALGGLYAARKAATMLWGFGQAASDTAESLSKVNVVFGTTAKQVEGFAAGAARNLGISNQAALEAAGTFGNLFVSMKIGEQPAADMSTSLVQLAGDLASFNNIPIEDALTALRAGLVGEIEPMRRLGVNMDAATIKAKAVELGLYKGKGAIDAAAKAQAAYAIIMEQTATAQGDYARTADGLANQQRTLGALWDDAKAQLGKGLMPVFQGFVGYLSEHMGDIVRFGQGVITHIAGAFNWLKDNVWPVAKDVFNRIWPLAQKVGDTIKTAFKTIAPILGPAISAIIKLLSPLLDMLNAILKAFDTVMGLGGAFKHGGINFWGNGATAEEKAARAAEVKAAGEAAYSALSSQQQTSADAIKKMFTGGAGGFASGGPIPGAADQAVPVIAHGGEFVLNKKDASNLSGIMATVASEVRMLREEVRTQNQRIAMLSKTGYRPAFRGAV